MGRKTTTVKRRVADEDGDEAVVEAEQDSEEKVEDRESVPDLVGATGAGMEDEEEESDPEIEELDEGFEEAEDVVNAVMELDPNEDEDPIEEDGISGDAEPEANLCEDGVIEVKNMNPNRELLAEEKDSDANCSNSPSGKDQDDVSEGNVVDDSDLLTRTEENLDEGVPSASELSKTDDDNDGEEEEEEESKEDNDGGEEESKEKKDDLEHSSKDDNVEANSNVVVKDNDDGEKESNKGRDDLEESGKDGNVEENKASSSNVSLGNARSVEIAATPMHRPRERVLLQVKTVCLQRLPKSWDVEKIKETCRRYGVIKRAELFRNFSKKGNDVGFVAFTTRESAVACVEGINNAQFGECKVKADIMRPFVGGRLRKDARKGFKVKEMCRRVLIEVPEKDSKLKGQIGINKPEMTEGLKMENAEGNHQVRTRKRNRGRGGRNKSQSGVIEARGDGMPSKGRRRKWRKGKRGGQQDDNQRPPPNKQSGNSQVHPRDNLRSTTRKPHFKRKPAHNAGRMPYAEKHAASASSSRRPGYARNGISRSKRPATYMQPHGGYLEHHRNHRRHIEPPRRHHQQIHPSYVNPSVRYEVAPRATYLQPVQTNDSLPHAGLMEFSANRSFGAYNGIPEQGSAYRGVNHFPPTYAPNYPNYAGYEGSSNGSGYRPSSEAYFHPRRPRY